MSTNNILWFREISDLNLNQVGNKALSISKIFNNNIAVPNGFCIPYEVFNNFQEETKIKEKIEEILSNLDVNNLNSLYLTSEKIQNLIINTSIPIKLKQQITEAYENINVDIDVYKLAGKNALELIKSGRETTYVAIRNSPLNNNLNHQPNILNIKGKEELIKTIQKCWASMFSAYMSSMRSSIFPNRWFCVSRTCVRLCLPTKKCCGNYSLTKFYPTETFQ